MGDRLILENGQAQLATDEGKETVYPEETLIEMMRKEIEPPIHDAAFPDGVKFVRWRPPFLCVVHQLAPHVRLLKWIRDDSPVPFGPGALFQDRRLSIPYSISFLIYCRSAEHLSLTGFNELYFRNSPLESVSDQLGYPALLNVSRIDSEGRKRAWLCTQHLNADPSAPWTVQLGALLEHTWNGAFTLSSEQHEGASWYGESLGVHESLHPVERWAQATAQNEAFALTVPWLPVALNVGQLMDAMLQECRRGHRHLSWLRKRRTVSRNSNLVSRFMNYAQKEAAPKQAVTAG